MRVGLGEGDRLSEGRAGGEAPCGSGRRRRRSGFSVPGMGLSPVSAARPLVKRGMRSGGSCGGTGGMSWRAFVFAAAFFAVAALRRVGELGGASSSPPSSRNPRTLLRGGMVVLVCASVVQLVHVVGEVRTVTRRW